MKTLRYLLFCLPLLLVSCGEKDEPLTDLFSITDVRLNNQEDDILIIKHECEVTINCKSQYIHVSLSGDFDNLNLLPPYSLHDWSVVTIGERDISVNVGTNATGAVRSDNIEFVVSKGSVKNVGTILIVQLPD